MRENSGVPPGRALGVSLSPALEAPGYCQTPLRGGVFSSHKFLSGFLLQTGVNAEIFGDLAESLISGPEKRGGIDQDGGDQVCVGQADA